MKKKHLALLDHKAITIAALVVMIAAVTTAIVAIGILIKVLI